MGQLRALKEHGLPILYVTHRLGEVFDIADNVTVLRDGRVALAGPVPQFTRADLVSAIVGHRAAEEPGRTPARATSAQDGKTLLECHRLVAPGIGPVDFRVGSGEIVAVFGLVGSGRTELLECLAGVRRASRGTLELDGRRLRLRRAADGIAQGIALVPSERLGKGLFAPLSAGDNVLLPRLPALSRLMVRRRRHERAEFSRATDGLSLQPPRPEMQARRYSGGNQQKLVLGRWLGLDGVRVLLLDEPTQGVDVGARDDLYAAVRGAVADGERGAVFASSDEEEVEALADRAVVLSRGRIVGELRGAEITARRLLELAHIGEAETTAA